MFTTLSLLCVSIVLAACAGAGPSPRPARILQGTDASCRLCVGNRSELSLHFQEPCADKDDPREDRPEIYDRKKSGSTILDQTLGVLLTVNF